MSRNASYAGLVPAHALAQVTPDSQAKQWRGRLTTETGQHAMYVVHRDGSGGGFAMGSCEGATATLQAIHVLPAWLGVGAGPMLHDRLVGDFGTQGCAYAELWVLQGNERAQAFYRRHGWIDDGGRDAHAIGGVDVPILRYRRQL